MTARQASAARSEPAGGSAEAGGREEPQLRTDLVEAALKLFTLHGYQSVTVAEIGAAADVTGPALYRHFESKQALLTAALLLAGDRTIAGARQIIAEAPTPRAALERMVRSWARAAIADESRLVIGYFAERRHIPADARRQLDAHYITYVDLIADTLGHIRPDFNEQERRLRVQAAMGMIASSPQYVSDTHQETLIEALTALSLATLTA